MIISQIYLFILFNYRIIVFKIIFNGSFWMFFHNLSLKNVCNLTTIPYHLYLYRINESITLCPSLLACNYACQIVCRFISLLYLLIAHLFRLLHHCFSWIFASLSPKWFESLHLLFSMLLFSLECWLNFLLALTILYHFASTLRSRESFMPFLCYLKEYKPS